MASKERLHLGLHLMTILSVLCLVSGTYAQCPTAICDCRSYDSRKEIRCTSKDLTSIPNNLPTDTLILRLEFNQITSISATDLSNLSQLKKLTLYNNMISYIDPVAFQNQGRLEILSLQHNRISNLTGKTFHDTRKIVELNLDNNLLKTFENGTFQLLSKLTQLTLSGNPLQSLPEGIFSDLSNLLILDVSNVNFNSIPETLFNGLTSLVTLKMNNVTQNGDIIFGSQTLFQSVSNLTTLEIRSNALTCLPAACSSLRALEILKLSSNPLTCGDFSGLRNFVNLEELHMEYANLTRITSGMFSGNINLLFLLIEESNLIELEEGAFEGLGGLEELILYGNNLTTLPPNIFDPIPTDVTLDLDSNPWICDCNFRWFHEWLTTMYTGDILNLQLVCAAPARLEGQQVIQIEDSQFACSPVSDVTNTTHSVNQGENFILRCGITGDPAPDLYWLTPDHTELFPDMNQGPYIIDGDCTLTIVRIQLKDAGAYSCVGTNSAGTVSVRNFVEVNPTGIERPATTAKASTQTTEKAASFATTPKPSMDTSSSMKDSTVIIIIALSVGFLVFAFVIIMILLRKKHTKKEHRASRAAEGGMVLPNEPFAENCQSPFAGCSNGLQRFPPMNERYSETLPRVPGSSPLDPPPPYSTTPPQPTYEEIGLYGQIEEDNVYERPRQPSDMTPKPQRLNHAYMSQMQRQESCQRLNHAYMSQMQRQESCVSESSCGAPGGYERSLFRYNSATENLYSPDTTPPVRRQGSNMKMGPGQVEHKYLEVLSSGSDVPQKEKASLDVSGVNVTRFNPDTKVTYQNTRRM